MDTIFLAPVCMRIMRTIMYDMNIYVFVDVKHVLCVRMHVVWERRGRGSGEKVNVRVVRM